MAIQITVRDVPEKVRDELAARDDRADPCETVLFGGDLHVRAALQGKSMQEYLRIELQRLASRPSVEAWLEQVRKRKRAAQARVSADQILAGRDADRR